MNDLEPAVIATRFFYLLERFEDAILLELLCSDCRWLRQGESHDGLEVIQAVLRSRSRTTVTRHLTSFPLVTFEGIEARVELLVVGYAGTVGAGGLPLLMVEPRQIADYRFSLRRVDTHWRIFNIFSASVFKSL